MTKTLTLAALSMCAAPAFAQGADECAAAVPLGTGPTTVAFDTNVCTDTGVAATTSSQQQCASLSVDVWFKYVAQTTGLASFDTCNNATFDTEIAVWEGSDCGTFVGLGCNDDAFALGCTGLTSYLTNISVTAGQTYYIQLGHYSTGGGVWGAGTITITEYPDPCVVNNDDSLEDNDTCLTAVSLAAGSNTGLYVSNVDADFYRISLPVGQLVDVTLSNMVNGDADLRIYDASCALLGTAETTGSYSNLGASGPIDVIFEVHMDPNAGTNCTNYDLDVALSLDPCAIYMPDAFEDNDDCASARIMGDGLYPGLTVFDQDNDYFAISLAPGATVTADIFFVDAQADVDLYLWDPLVECDTNVVGTGGMYLARGFSASDDEQITYTNISSGTENLILEVDMFTGSGCNTYDLQIMGVGTGIGPIGTNFCQANNNSTGVPGAMSAEGSTIASVNDVTLTASSLPINQFGIFVVGATAGFVPNGGGTSNGNICIGGVVGRYNQMGQILSTGAGGTFSLRINLPTIPQGNGNVQTMAGDSWFFQAWHRSGVGLGSNFTDGLEINFN